MESWQTHVVTGVSYLGVLWMDLFSWPSYLMDPSTFTDSTPLTEIPYWLQNYTKPQNILRCAFMRFYLLLCYYYCLCVWYIHVRESECQSYLVAVRESLVICPPSSVVSRGRLGSSGLHGKCFYPLSHLACHVTVDFQVLSSSQKEPCFTYHGICLLMRQNVHIPNYSVMLFTIFLSVKHIPGSLFFLVKVTFIYYF